MEKMNTTNRNDYVLLTGATSGIGYELAKLFAADGFHLILVARNAERLQEVADELKTRYSVEVTPLSKDLFQPSAAQEIYDFTKRMGIEVSVLVNDAGQGQWGPFVETELQRDLDIIQLNISSLVSLTKLYLRDMVAMGRGKILQLGSEAGTTPVPLLSVYAATKAFVLSFSAALANEMKDKNVTVTVLLPGATDTDFFHKAEQEDTVIYKEEKLSAPEEVALDGYQALMKGENKIISGAKTKYHVWMADFVGAKMSAENMRKKMEPSMEADGRDESKHEASRKERAAIREKTNALSGDSSIGNQAPYDDSPGEIKPF